MLLVKFLSEWNHFGLNFWRNYYFDNRLGEKCMAIKVSIMITFYNQKKYIKQCLESILSQKVDFEYEILCGDDGSNDGTYDELKKWQSKYNDKISLFQMERDENVKYEPIVRVSANRINLLKHSKGEYVTFLDGDDYYDDIRKLSRQIMVLDKIPECVGCGHPIKRIWENNEIAEDIVGSCGTRAVIIPRNIYWKYTWLHADTLIFRNMIKDSIDDLNTEFFDDNIITCYFLKYGDIAYLPTPMCVYRQIGNSSWNDRSDLRKAIVNIQVYHAACRILKSLKYESFIKTYPAWKTLFNHRNDSELKKAGLNGFASIRFINETLKYRDMNYIGKVFYNIKYFIPMHLEIFIFLIRKFRFIHYKRIREFE